MDRVRLAPDLDVFCLNLAEARFLFQEIAVDQTYLRHGVVVEDGDCVVDVGANIGLFGVYLHHRRDRIRLYCIEPIPQVFDVLKANAALHGLNARLFNCGLAGRAGRAAFTFYPNNSVMSGRYADNEGDRRTTRTYIGNRSPSFIERARRNPLVSSHFEGMIDNLFESVTADCDLRRLSEIIREEEIRHIDLLKIDVEKSEHEVLAGIDDEDWSRIRQIVVEVHNVEGRLVYWTDRLRAVGFQVTVDQDPMLASTEIYVVYARRA